MFMRSEMWKQAPEEWELSSLFSSTKALQFVDFMKDEC